MDGKFQNNPTNEPIVIQPILERYSVLGGYNIRKRQLAEIIIQQYHAEGSGKNPMMKWWPWQYELIVFQWKSLLLLFHDKDK